jgi:hypothetical protein
LNQITQDTVRSNKSHPTRQIKTFYEPEDKALNQDSKISTFFLHRDFGQFWFWKICAPHIVTTAAWPKATTQSQNLSPYHLEKFQEKIAISFHHINA